MPEKLTVDILDLQRKKVGEFDLTPFLNDKLEDHGEIYFALKAYEGQAKSRCGYTKGRSEINGTMKKMYQQKGTGQARHSTYKAPLFVGGGIAHGPKAVPRSIKVNKRVWRKAMQILLKNKIQDSQVLVFDDMAFDQRKTKKAAQLFPEVSAYKTLFVDRGNTNLAYSVRNIEKARYLEPEFVNIHDMAYGKTIVFSKGALDVFMTRIKKHLNRGARQ